MKAIKLSANWMANSSSKKELFNLYTSVNRLSSICRKFDIVVPVGKDSLSMSTKWKDQKNKEVKSPISLVLSAFSSISDVEKYVTPRTEKNSQLFLLDLGNNANRMGGSALDQTCNINNNEPPKINNLKDLNNFFNCAQALIKNNILNAYHDKSDGGLITTIIEMGFASNMSIKLNKLNLNDQDLYKFLFNEELGGVFAISKNNKISFLILLKNIN
jgi:phosphoribosylformylglycinamidine synthase